MTVSRARFGFWMLAFVAVIVLLRLGAGMTCGLLNVGAANAPAKAAAGSWPS